jgi:protein O-GlcNAc transferase
MPDESTAGANPVPHDAASWDRLGTALFQQKRWNEAAEAFRHMAASDPQRAAAWSSLGGALWMLGDLAAADDAYQRSLAIAADDLPTQLNYARILLDRRRSEQALKVLEQILARQPNLVVAWVATGDAFLMAGDNAQSLIAYRRAIELAPADRDLASKIASTLAQHGLPEDAEPLIQQLIAQQPQSAEAWALLSLLRHRQVRTAESAEAMRTSLQLNANSGYHSTLLCLLQYGEGATAARLLDAHRQWDSAHAAVLLPKSPPIIHRDGNRPLRIGFVSADFGQHPAAYLVLPALEHLDKTQCTIFCYADRIHEDEHTARFRAVADTWRIALHSSDEELAEQIRQDQIDILFDLMGHNGKRLLVFARKPAPLQITWFGYVGTTGMAAMDYLLADRFHVRAGEEAQYAERILRLPHGYACYGPPADAPDVRPLPALASGQVTFGSFNNPAKLSPSTIDAWSQILRRVPNSQILLKFRGYEQPPVRERVQVEFAQRSIPPGRILFEGWSPYRELLETYHRIDIALDTQPYSGGLTTCEALWMGVPVVTLPGKTFAGRHSTSHLASAGYPQFIANDWPGYMDIAAHWANRVDDLALLRSQMRDRMRQSPLCDAPTFAADLLSVLQQVAIRPRSP